MIFLGGGQKKLLIMETQTRIGGRNFRKEKKNAKVMYSLTLAAWEPTFLKWERLRPGLVNTIRHGCEAVVRPPRGERTQGEGRFVEVDGHTEQTQTLGLGRETM